MKRINILVVLVLIVLMMLSACAPKTETTTTTSAKTTTTTVAKTTNTEKKITIGATFHSTYHEFFAEMIAGMKDEAAKNNVELIISDENMDIAKQNATMETFIQEGVDAIILLSIDPEALNAAALDAMAVGIPVILIDSGLTNEDAYVSFIGSDSEAMGKMAGEAASDYITKEMGGKAVVAALGWLSHPVSVKRVTGFKEIVTQLPGVTWVTEQEADSRDKALTVAENLLQSDPDITLFYGGNEGTVLGELAAVESANMLDKVKITGIDISNDVIRAIEEGKIPFVVTQQPEEMGRVAITTCLKAINGETVNKNQVISSIVVTKDNVADFKK